MTGLLTGRDVAKQLSGQDLGDRLLLSESMLRDGGDLFLDDMSPAQLESALGVPVEMVPDGASLARSLLERKC